MLELEDADPGGHPMGGPLMDVPVARAEENPEGQPLREDDQVVEDEEESLADIPWIEGHLAQPWVTFEAQVNQDEVQHWATMFAWFQALQQQWERNWREKDMTSNGCCNVSISPKLELRIPCTVM